jgi:hypothetical protein
MLLDGSRARFRTHDVLGGIRSKNGKLMSETGQTRTCLTVGASSAFPPVADIQCGCAVELFRQTGFWEHRPVKVKRSNARGALSRFSALLRETEVARSKLVERTGVQGFHLVTLCSASADQASRAATRPISCAPTVSDKSGPESLTAISGAEGKLTSRLRHT